MIWKKVQVRLHQQSNPKVNIGVTIYSYGASYEGELKENKLHGKHTDYNADGSMTNFVHEDGELK